MMLLWPWAKLEQRAVCAERCTYGSGRRSALALLTPLKITGWGWYYLSTVLDDFSRYIVAWKLCATMGAEDVTATLDLALSAAGLDHVTVGRRPRLLSDNGSSYVAGDLAKWLEDKGIEHVRGAPYHPQTQGKIERWHQTLNRRSKGGAGMLCDHQRSKRQRPPLPHIPLGLALSDASPGDEATIQLGDCERAVLYLSLERETQRAA